MGCWGSTHPRAAVALGTHPPAIGAVDNHRVDVLGGAKVLAGPPDLAKLLVGRVARVEAAARPGAGELVRRDGVRGVEELRDLGPVDASGLVP